MADEDLAYDGPLPAGKAAKRTPPKARRAAPIPQQASGPQQSKPAAPQAPAPPPLQTFIPRLNQYVQAKVSKSSGEVGSYIEAASSLGPTASPQQLARTLLPRLALYGALPPSLVPQLLPALLSEDKRAARLAAYLVQVQLGCGIAGTPTLPPMRGGEVLVPAPVPVEIMARAWNDIVQEDAGVPSLQRALRTLVAAARGYPTLLKKDLATGIEIVLDRAGQVNPLQPPGKKELAEAALLRYSAMAATRAGIADAKPADHIARRILRQVISSDPLTARHALALAVDVARKDPRSVLEGLGPMMADSVFKYASSDLKKLNEPKKLAEGVLSETVNFADKFARVYLARLCSAVVHSERIQASLPGDASYFFQMLALLATKDESSLVGIEAIRLLAGHFPQRKAGIGLDGASMEISAQDARARARAWQVLLNHSEMEAKGNSRSSQTQVTLITVIGERLSLALNSNSPALVCCAARVAGALGEARTRSGFRGTRSKKHPEAGTVMAELAEELQAIAEGPAGPAIRCAALEALFWFQVPGQSPKITPLSLLRNVTASGVGQAAWPRDLLESVMSTIAQAERAMPSSAQLLMSCAGAVAAASPSGVSLSRIVEMWTAALRAGRAGKEAALHAALGILSSPSPPSANAPTGASVEVLARAAAEDAAWLAFQRMSAWWLGENANVAANEYAGTSGMTSNNPADLGFIKPPSGRVEIATHGQQLSAGEVIALQASENPAMMAVVAQLQHATLTMPWEVRTAAAQAIAKIAVRSEEPYRIHCYSILRSLAASDHTSGNDSLGVASVVAPAVRILDMVYATRITLQDLARRYGEKPLEWPVHVVEQLTARNTAILTAIEEQIGGMPPGVFHPLGPVGKELLKAAATDGLEAFRGGLEYMQRQAEAEQAAFDARNEDFGNSAITLAEETQQPALGPDGRPVWLQRLVAGGDGGAAAASSDEEETPQGGAQESTFTMQQPDNDDLSAMMSQLDQQIFKPQHKQRASWERMPVPAEQYATSGYDAPESPVSVWPPPPRAVTPRAATPTYSRHSRASSWADTTPRKELNGRALVLYDFEGADEQELSVFEGQEVNLHYESDDWLMVSTETGRRGLVPVRYVRILTSDPYSSGAAVEDPFGGGDPFAAAAVKPSDATSSYDDPFAERAADDPFAEPEPAPVDYSPTAAQRDPFSTAVEQSEPSSGRVRHAPRASLLNIDDSYLAENAAATEGGAIEEPGFLEDYREDLAGEEPSFSANLPPPQLRRAAIAHDFTPESEEEVAVIKGDEVEVEGEEIEGWLQVMRLSDGATGLVPAWSVAFT